MNLSIIQTELVACALCEADGKNPDEDVPTGKLEVVSISQNKIVERAMTKKAWHDYEDEARRFIVAARAMEKWSRTLTMFRSVAPAEDRAGFA